MAIELGELLVRLVGNADSYSSMLTRASQLSNVAVKNMDRVIGASASVSDRFEQFAFKLGLFGQAAQNVGRILSVSVTAPIVAFGAIAVKSFADFDRAMAHSAAVMGTVAPDMRKSMEQTAIGLSTKSVTTAEDLAKAYGFLASAGLDAAQSQAALSTVNDFAIAGDLKLTDSVEYLTSAQQALGLGSADATKNMENMTRVADVFTRANQLSAGTIEDFATAMTTKFAGALRQTGKSLEEGTALLMMFAQKGLRGAAAGTAGTRLVAELGTEVLRHAKEWKAFGIEVFDSNNKLKSFPAIVRSAEKAMVGFTDKQKRMMFMRLGLTARAASDFQTLLGSSDVGDKFWSQLLGAKGASHTMAEDMQKNLSDRFTILKNNVVAAAIEIGQTFLPIMNKAIALVQKGIDAWRGLSEEQKKSVVQWAAIAATAGPALILLGSGISLIASALPILAAATPAAVALGGAVLMIDWSLGRLGITQGAVFDSFTKHVGQIRLDSIQISSWITAIALELNTNWETFFANMHKMWAGFGLDVKEAFNTAQSAGVEVMSTLDQARAYAKNYVGLTNRSEFLQESGLIQGAKADQMSYFQSRREKFAQDHAERLVQIDKERTDAIAKNERDALELFKRDQEKKQELVAKTGVDYAQMHLDFIDEMNADTTPAMDEATKEKKARFPAAFAKSTNAQVFSSKRFSFDGPAAQRIYQQNVRDDALVTEAKKTNQTLAQIRDQGNVPAIMGE